MKHVNLRGTATMVMGVLATVVSLSTPVQAAFYLEGLMPLTDAPNCTDPYATTCGRYGQIPHDKDLQRDHKMSEEVAAPRDGASSPSVRMHTREGLEK